MNKFNQNNTEVENENMPSEDETSTKVGNQQQNPSDATEGKTNKR